MHGQPQFQTRPLPPADGGQDETNRNQCSNYRGSAVYHSEAITASVPQFPEGSCSAPIFPLAEIAVNQGRADRDLGLAIGIPVGSSLEGRRLPHNFDLDFAHAKKTELENGLAEATKAPR